MTKGLEVNLAQRFSWQVKMKDLTISFDHFENPLVQLAPQMVARGARGWQNKIMTGSNSNHIELGDFGLLFQQSNR